MKRMLIGNKGIAILVCIACIVAGIVAWGCMMSMGLLQTTGMGNIFDWGLLIAIFAFLVGFGAGSQFVASYIILGNKQDLKPYAAISQSIAIGGAVGAAVAVMADLGHPLNIFAMLMHPNAASPLVWDMVALTLFIVVAVVCLAAIVKEWKSARIWMGVGALCALALQLVEGLLFALMEARAWWHSFIMPLDFIVVACVCGLAIITVICCYTKRQEAIVAARKLSGLLFVFAIAHVCLSLVEVVMLACESVPGAESAFELLGSYAVLYVEEIGICLVAAIVLRVNLENASRKKIMVCAALIIVAMFAHRLMLLYPALGGVTLFTALSNQASPFWAYPASTGFLADVRETFALTQPYVPAFAEWISVLLPIGLAVLIVIVATNIAAYCRKG